MTRMSKEQHKRAELVLSRLGWRAGIRHVGENVYEAISSPREDYSILVAFTFLPNEDINAKSTITKRAPYEDGRYPIATCEIAYLPTTHEAYHDDELPWQAIPLTEQWPHRWAKATGTDMRDKGWHVRVEGNCVIGDAEGIGVSAELPDYGWSKPYVYTMGGEIGPTDCGWEVVAELTIGGILSPEDAVDQDWSLAEVRIPQEI